MSGPSGATPLRTGADLNGAKSTVVTNLGAGLHCEQEEKSLCKSAGQQLRIAIEAWWWRRADGVLQIQVASRLTQRQDLLEPFGITTPLWSGTTLLVNPDVPRTAEVNGDPDASQMVRILGATWLLMDQRTVAETRTLQPTQSTAPSDTVVPPSSVSMVELRRKLPESRERTTTSTAAERTYHSRWWVEGHWRQQACGPGWSQRKPLYITDYERARLAHR